jgi:hypothetical protein
MSKMTVPLKGDEEDHVLMGEREERRLDNRGHQLFALYQSSASS